MHLVLCTLILMPQAAQAQAAKCPFKLKPALAEMEALAPIQRDMAMRVRALNDTLRKFRSTTFTQLATDQCSDSHLADLSAFDSQIQALGIEPMRARARVLEGCADDLNRRIQIALKDAENKGETQRLMRLSTIRSQITDLVSGSNRLAVDAEILRNKAARLLTEASDLGQICSEASRDDF